MTSPQLSPQRGSTDELPLVSQQPLEIDFLENRLHAYRDEDGNLPARFSTEAQRFIALLPTSHTRTPRGQSNYTLWNLEEEELTRNELALVSTKKNFETAIRQLQLQAGKADKDKIARFHELQKCHDWDEVVSAINVAVQKHEDDKSVGGKFRKMFRNVGDHAKSIQTFVGLLPDGH